MIAQIAAFISGFWEGEGSPEEHMGSSNGLCLLTGTAGDAL